MSRNGLITLEYAAIAVLSAAAAAQSYRTYIAWSNDARARTFVEAQASGAPSAVAHSGTKLLSGRTPEANLALLVADQLIEAKQFDAALSVYDSVISSSAPDVARAAAFTGKAAVTLGLTVPPTQNSIAKAVGFLEKARATASFPDTEALMAVAKLHGDDLDATRAVVEGVSKRERPMALGPALAFQCVVASTAMRAGDPVAALAALRRASLLKPHDASPTATFIYETIASLEREVALAPEASERERANALAAWKEKSAESLVGDGEYRALLRAGASFLGSKNRAQADAGAELLKVAAAARDDDPTPVLMRVSQHLAELAPLVAKALADAPEEIAEAGGESAGALDLRPKPKLVGKAKPSPKAGAKQLVNKALALLVEKELPALEQMRTAVERLLRSGDDGAARAFQLAYFLYWWKERQVALTGQPEQRAAIAAAAAETGMWMVELFADKWPASADAAVVLRNSGLLLSQRGADKRTFELLKRSLQCDPSQKDLADLFGQQPELEVAGTWPRGDRTHHAPTVFGVELRLPPGMESLAECTLAATLGAKGGVRTRVEPIVSGTGLWYFPKDEELVDGPMEATFSVSHPKFKGIEARTGAIVDRAPPVIAARSPAPDSPTAERTPLITISWEDPAGIDPSSVEIAIEPVKANYIRQTLVSAGKQRRGRAAGDLTWYENAEAAADHKKTSGSIVTAAPSEIPAGVYRIRVTFSDKFGQAVSDSWEFTVQ